MSWEKIKNRRVKKHPSIFFVFPYTLVPEPYARCGFPNSHSITITTMNNYFTTRFFFLVSRHFGFSRPFRPLVLVPKSVRSVSLRQQPVSSAGVLADIDFSHFSRRVNTDVLSVSGISQGYSPQPGPGERRCGLQHSCTPCRTCVSREL